MNFGKSQDKVADAGTTVADQVYRMPVENSPSAIQAARKRRAKIVGRSGRSSTKLAGSGAYRNSFLGDV